MVETGRELAELARRVARDEAEPNLIDHATYFTNLPTEYYVSEEIFKTEMRKVFSRQWLYAGQLSQLQKPGDYYVRDVGPESLIIARDMEGRLRAFFNVCRHRGSRICKDNTAGNAKIFVCPYHSWTFGIDGRLKAAPGARDGREFNFADWRLTEAHCDSYFGSIYVYLADETPPQSLDDFLSAFTSSKEKLALVQPERTKVAARRVYDLKCNWKVMMENFGECYHCVGGHPTLARACNIPISFLTDEGEVQPGAVGALYTFNKGYKTVSVDGDWVSRKRLGTPQDAGFTEGWVTFPHFCGIAYHADYGTAIGVEPISVDSARLYCEWFVHEDAVEGVDYDVNTLIEGWDKTNREDAFLTANNYKGIRSMRFKPGPHVVNREAAVRTALTSYLSLLNAPDA
jgi:Rieske 2Fe-2S family protein